MDIHFIVNALLIGFSPEVGDDDEEDDHGLSYPSFILHNSSFLKFFFLVTIVAVFHAAGVVNGVDLSSYYRPQVHLLIFYHNAVSELVESSSSLWFI